MYAGSNFGEGSHCEGDDKSVFITALDHMVEFEDGKSTRAVPDDFVHGL